MKTKSLMRMFLVNCIFFFWVINLSILCISLPMLLHAKENYSFWMIISQSGVNEVWKCWIFFFVSKADEIRFPINMKVSNFFFVIINLFLYLFLATFLLFFCIFFNLFSTHFKTFLCAQLCFNEWQLADGLVDQLNESTYWLILTGNWLN